MRIDERQPNLLAGDAAPLQAGGYEFEFRWHHVWLHSQRRFGLAAAGAQILRTAAKRLIA
jgi:hypothetical protein